MEIAEHAWNVLTAASLADKLRAPESALSDHAPAARQAAALRLQTPERPAGLRFCDRLEKRHIFPRRKELRHASGRARALHFFANHELMAIEVCARALLVYPDAAPQWRAELTETLSEEQLHLRLYIERMEALGLGFGDVPVNDYIWKHALDVPSSRGFIAFFSLTLEGANLDHALEYKKLFEQRGDEESAALMARVLADEIVHVRRGLECFKQGLDASEDLFTAYARELIWPINPARGRAKQIHRAPRRAAGLPPDFIAALAASSRRLG